jgi:hypothetical protein
MATSDEQRRWLAAFFEKNGTIDAHLQRNGNRLPRLMVVATSELLLKTLARYAGMGRLTGPSRRAGKATVWRWTVTKRDDVDRFVNRVRPLLSKARQEEIRRVYAQCDSKFTPPKPIPQFKPPKPE